MIVFVKLSEREKEVALLIAGGLKGKDIANKIFIGKRAVDKHRSNIYEKLNVGSSTLMINQMLKLGMIVYDKGFKYTKIFK